MKPLDNLGHPVSIIHEAEELAAEALGPVMLFLWLGNYVFCPDHDFSNM